MKKVIVTGANGFVGYWLVRELVNNNVQVIAVVRNEQTNVSKLKELGNNIQIVCCELSQIEDLTNLIAEDDYDAFYH